MLGSAGASKGQGAGGCLVWITGGLMYWYLIPTQPTTCRVTAPCARHRAVLEGLSACPGTQVALPRLLQGCFSPFNRKGCCLLLCSLPALLNLHGSEVMPTKVCSAGLYKIPLSNSSECFQVKKSPKNSVE